MTSTQVFSDYRAVDGIMFPHTIVMTGGAPVPLELKVSKIEINSGLDDSTFRAK